jgi:spermidine/putrescine transport system substrate-binding protein
VAKTISEEIGYATPNSAALRLMAPEVRNNPIVYPDVETVKKGEFQVDVGEAILVYQKYWEKLKAGQ